MNERIKKLVWQAGFVSIRDEYLFTEMMERFAELIVRECLLKIENERYELPDFIVDSVKQHFGVKDD